MFLPLLASGAIPLPVALGQQAWSPGPCGARGRMQDFRLLGCCCGQTSHLLISVKQLPQHTAQRPGPRSAVSR